MKKKPLYIFFLLSFSFHSKSQIGNSLVLNGCTDYFEIADNDLLDYNQILSIEAWIKPNCEDGNRIILSKQWCGPSDFGYYLSVNEGRLFWSFNRTGDCVNRNNHRSRNIVISTSQFTHIAVVHSLTEIKLFINGLLVNSEQITGRFSTITNSSEPLRIGAYKNRNGDFTNHYSGLIDEIRLWNIELGESLIQSRMNTSLTGNEPGLVLYLDMDDQGEGQSLELKNKSIIGGILDARSVGYTASSPFIISPDLYDQIAFNIGEDIKSCQDLIIINSSIIDFKGILWNTGETSPSIVASNPGVYTVTVETELCKFLSDTIVLSRDKYIFQNKEFRICEGDSLFLNDKFYYIQGIYSDTILSNISCDTVLELSVIEIPAILQTLALATCPGTTILYNNTELAAGTTTSFHFKSTTGCDSIITVTVTANQAFEEEVMLFACEGNQIEYQGTLLSPNTSTIFNFTTINGCDSIITVTVTANQAFEEEVMLFACEGSQIEYQGTLLSPNTSTIFNFTTIDGCDSIITVTVTAIQAFEEELVLFACEGNQIEYQGTLLSPGTSTIFSFTTIDGCDSLVKVIVNPRFPINITEAYSFCENDTISVNGINYYQSGTFLDTLLSITSCDTFLEISISIIPSFSKTEIIEVCPNSTVMYQGVELSPNTRTSFVIKSTEGCDTNITVDIRPTLSFYEEHNFLVCKGNTFEYNDVTVTPNTTKVFSLISQDGCDSIVTVHVTIANPHQDYLGNDTLICNDNFTINSLSQNTYWNNGDFSNNLLINETGLYIATYTDSLGCLNIDSIYIELQLDQVYIPNSFSPNQDGNNDYFKPYFEENTIGTKYILTIFNRWGDLVFRSSEDQTYWDGTFSGKPLNPAVFVWILEYNNAFCNEKLLKHGSVSLLK